MPEWMKATFGQKSLRATKQLTTVVAALLPVKGFLGTGAPFAADFNLVMQLIMGAALIAGVLFAKRKCYRTHGICQTTVLLVNLLTIGLVMWPSFQQQVKPMFPKAFHRGYYAVAAMHAFLGITARRWDSILSSWLARTFFRSGYVSRTGSVGCGRRRRSGRLFW